MHSYETAVGSKTSNKKKMQL